MDTAPGGVGFDVSFGIKFRLRITALSIVRISTDVFQQTGDFCSKLPNPPPEVWLWKPWNELLAKEIPILDAIMFQGQSV